MMRVFGALLAARRGEMTAEVISAQPLGTAQHGALAGALARTVAVGRHFVKFFCTLAEMSFF